MNSVRFFFCSSMWTRPAILATTFSPVSSSSASIDPRFVRDLKLPACGNFVLLVEDFAVDHGGDTHTVTPRKPQHAADVRDDRPTLRLLAGLEQFFHARQTARDVTG